VRIDSGDAYADGISIVHGSPRIWTFAVSCTEITAKDFDRICPCSVNSNNGVDIPTTFVIQGTPPTTVKIFSI